MTSVVEKINQVIASGLLIKGLYRLPSSNANDAEISDTEDVLPFKLSDQYKEFLRIWNGANLDVIRIFGIGKTDDSIPSLKCYQFDYNSNGLIIIASDPAGFIYGQDISGSIFSIDSDGDTTDKIADNFDDFICNYLFGQKANAFGGHSWVEELIDAKIYNKHIES